MERFEVDENVIMYAFRYCLGRKTYAVSEMVSILICNWRKLKQHTQIQIKQEIADAKNRNCLGMDCDIEQWNKVVDLKIKED